LTDSPVVEECDEAVGEQTPFAIAAEALTTLSDSLPSKLVFPTAFGTAMQLCRSPNPLHRRGAFGVISSIAQGCSERLLNALPDVVSAIGVGRI
jgi:hypothetical protein